MRRIVAVGLCVGVSLLGWICAGAQEKPPAATFWASGRSLMPAWGFYPNGSEYGGTKSLDTASAWTPGGVPGRLTWVAAFPAAGRYHVWVRAYGGYGKAAVSVDGAPVAGGRGGPGGARYTWRHHGAVEVAKGSHHVDIEASGMFDAVLFTADESFLPEKGPLPEREAGPVLRARRAYLKDDDLKQAAGRAGFVVAPLPRYAEVLNDFVPDRAAAGAPLAGWGCADQYVPVWFGVRALETAGEMKVSLAELRGPGTARVPAADIDLKVVLLRERLDHLFSSTAAPTLCADVLVRDDRTGFPPKGKQGGFGGGACVARIPAHESRQFVATVRIPPGSPAGVYRGMVLCDAGPSRQVRTPLEIAVLPLELRPAEGHFGIYHPVQPLKSDSGNYVTPERYLAELKDMVRHGLNATTLYGGFETLKYAKEAGMTKAPCVMSWPSGAAPQQVAVAKEMGFDDLYYYGVDEPNKPEQIERCRKEAERRQKLGLRMFTAINSRPAQEATKDFIDRPVYNLYVFGGRDNAAAAYARGKGFVPVSYWTTATAYPLWFRAMTGLYNKACGYEGTSPWAYCDYADARAYDGTKTVHQVAYPDEFGEPMPTPGWEAHREGIDDVRYLEALDRAIARGEEALKKPSPPSGLASAVAKAKEVRAARYESVKGRWFEYLCAIRNADLDDARRAMADATAALAAVLK